MDPNCGKEWSRQFLTNNFTKQFMVKKYKSHLEDILFDREKSLMPSTQPLVEKEIYKENITREIHAIDEKIRQLQMVKNNILNEYRENTNPMKTNGTTETKFIRSCANEECRGFLNSSWICGICECVTCKLCHEIKQNSEHICNPDSVETAKLLSKDTKPCPTCHTQIFKISGCDQMWCTQCKTAFSWKTGAIEKNIHNPHYYEWKRQNGGLERAQGDVECGRELSHHIHDRIRNVVLQKHSNLYERKVSDINSYSKRQDIEFHPLIHRIMRIVMNVIHLNHVVLPSFQLVNTNIINEQARIKYLRNKINEKEFKTCIQKTDKKQRKNTEIVQVLQLINIAVTDTIYRILDRLQKNQPNECNLDIISEFDGIIEHCNKIFKEISKTYDSVTYFLNDQFQLNS
jgi:hypothetical protein